MFWLVLAVGAVFSPLAAVMAWLITYEELGHHGLARRDALRHALGVAGVTLGFFLVVACLVAWWAERFLAP